MAKVIGSAPILLVREVVSAANYYRDCLESRIWTDNILSDKRNFQACKSN
jgi:hypothetical protein